MKKIHLNDSLLAASMVFLLGIWGILTIVSSQSLEHAPFFLVWRQSLFLLIGMALLIVTAQVSFQTFRRRVWGLAVCFLLALLFLPRWGVRVNGMTGWYQLGAFWLQPSELGKGIYILFLAMLMTRLHGDWRRFLWSGLLAGAWIIPVLLQPDFGTAVLYLSSLAMIYYLAGGGWGKLVALGGVGTAIAIGFILTHPYAWRRIVGLYDPDADPLGSGWHIRQLQLAIARGGWFGFKLGGAYWSSAYVPLAYNDSALATMLETLGIVGILPAVIAYVLLILALTRLAGKNGLHPDARLTIWGSALLLTAQALLHAGVNVCLLPPTGLTLPFISYGGSSLLGCCLLVGIALSAAADADGSKPVAVSIRPEDKTS